MTNLLVYNAFGMLIVQKHSIKAYITRFNNKRISDIVIEDDCALSQVGEDEYATVTFGVQVIDGVSRNLTVQQHTKLASGVSLTSIPAVANTINQSVDIAKNITPTFATYNAFGMMRIQRNALDIYISYNNGLTNSQVFHADVTLPEIGSDESVAATFGALMSTSDKPAPVIMQHSALETRTKIEDIPQVTNELRKAIDFMTRHATN
jgi:hypothetical protein